MVEHHIQKQIIQRLSSEQSLRFSALKPDGIENKLFDYHLKITIRDGLVEKSETGEYQLSSEGRRTWQRVSNDPNWLASVAYSVLFLVIRRKQDGMWLLYTRRKHPLLGKVGFMHCVPRYEESIVQTARESVLERSGLDCAFSVLGNGYFRIFDGENLESFTHFNLLVCDVADGELQQNDPSASFEWVAEPDFSSPDMIQNMSTLHRLYKAGRPFFVEETYKL